MLLTGAVLELILARCPSKFQGAKRKKKEKEKKEVELWSLAKARVEKTESWVDALF